jgi:two-component system, cell cycle sensor histidine kinase and response regulator CckA
MWKIMTTNNQQAYPTEDFGLLVGGTAHDLNNLITGAQLQAALAIRKLSSDNPAATHISKVIEAMEHMTLFVNHLLSQSKGGQMRNSIDLNALVSKCVNISSLIIGEDVRIDLNLSPDLPYVFVDKIQIQQLILNLVLNAVESLYATGQSVAISTGFQPSLQMSKEPGWWVTGEDNCLNEAVYFEIKDTGSGISSEKLHRVFDPYYSTKDEGRGLGLPLVLEVVRSHNGRLLVSSSLGKGTKFKAFFPVGVGEKSSAPTVFSGWVQ